MEITEIRIRKVFQGGSKLKGIVSITIDNQLAIHEIKIVQGQDRIFVAMPSVKDRNGIYRDVVHPISVEARDIMEQAIMREYVRFCREMADTCPLDGADPGDGLEEEGYPGIIPLDETE